ncbi:MAG: UDP-N-acetylmuramate--L-alanine ligase [Synergistaceae bacterium]|jgi:UDP-N-acetylmuramate--alanine ligase|nr:UDP-N-acetylmuramate--L-alanine ligase [Synergistaceae bacterium]
MSVLEAEIFIDIKNHKNIHLMGIGGAGMSGLALLLNAMGHNVSGCDAENSFYVEKVRRKGVEISMGHHKAHLDHYRPELIIHTSAIAQDHPELIEARRRGIPVARRAEVLSLIFNSRKGVGVAGTHGKTTTSSMIALLSELAGMDPTVAIGGELSDIGCNAKLGKGEYMVAELDESDGSFELFSPEVTVITNIDWDHVDHYPTYDSVVEAFLRHARGRKQGSPLIACGEDAGVRELLTSGIGGEAVTYGWGCGWDWGATDVRHQCGGGVRYALNRNGRPMGDVRLKISGEHNILNSLAALASAEVMGIRPESYRKSIEIFKGAKRRMQYIGESEGIIVYDDYGHHPREIAATLSAMNAAFHRRLHVIFQPHRYTRTQALYRDFSSTLRHVDKIYILPIYSADETPISGVSSFLIADELGALGRDDAVVCGDFQEAAEQIYEAVRPGDVVLTIGAGSIECLGRQILKRLEGKFQGDAEAIGA